MNAVKRQRPGFSPDDVDRLLFELEDARNSVVRYAASRGFHSAEYELSHRLMEAVDDLAANITGKRKYFHSETASAGGKELAFLRGKEKDAKRRRLFGVRFPVRTIKVSG